jgi:hypothetical protein
VILLSAWVEEATISPNLDYVEGGVRRAICELVGWLTASSQIFLMVGMHWPQRGRQPRQACTRVVVAGRCCAIAARTSSSLTVLHEQTIMILG